MLSLLVITSIFLETINMYYKILFITIFLYIFVIVIKNIKINIK